MDDQEICAFCGQPASMQCQRCARGYCEAHGAAFCNACADAVASLPSPVYVRVVTWGFAILAVLGILLFVRGPAIAGANTASKGPGPARSATRTPTRLPPATNATGSATPTAASDYTVKDGDTLASIAQSSGTTIAAILQLNPNVDPSNLRVGQTLHIPARSP
jgi:hypothetical protein